MRFIINALAAAVLGLPCGLHAQGAGGNPACRATLDGDRLTTAIEFTNGYIVEGPWRIVRNRPTSLEDGRNGLVMDAVLDQIVETEPGTGQRVSTALPDPIETSFEGHTEEELVYRAAQIWCLTVLELQREAPASAPDEPAEATRRS